MLHVSVDLRRSSADEITDDVVALSFATIEIQTAS